MPRKFFFALVAIVTILLHAPVATHAQQPAQRQQQIAIDAAAPSTPFPHFWEQMFGSGHANLAMRESYRDDMRAVKKVTGFPVCALPRHL